MSTIEDLLKQGKSKELILSIVNGEIDQYIVGLGLNKIADDYANRLLVDSLTKATGFSSLVATENIIQDVGLSTEQLVNTYRDTVLGYFQANTNRLKSELLSGLLDGTPSSEISKRLRSTFVRVSDGTTHILSDANINTVIQTSFSNVSRLSTARAFADEPEQRFEYVGGVIPTSSDQCKWLMENQDPKGYTKAEIDAGITTPFGTINWQGRQPNYNCLHEWLPVG